MKFLLLCVRELKNSLESIKLVNHFSILTTWCSGLAFCSFPGSFPGCRGSRTKKSIKKFFLPNLVIQENDIHTKIYMLTIKEKNLFFERTGPLIENHKSNMNFLYRLIVQEIVLLGRYTDLESVFSKSS